MDDYFQQLIDRIQRLEKFTGINNCLCNKLGTTNCTYSECNKILCDKCGIKFLSHWSTCSFICCSDKCVNEIKTIEINEPYRL